MSLKNKQKLVELLVKTEQFETASSLADQLGVSPRTVYSYLDEIEDVLIKSDTILEKKPGLGTRIIGDAEAKNGLLLSMHQKGTIDLDPIERQAYLLKALLKGKRMSYIEMAEQYYVSRSTIVKDIKAVKKRYTLDDQLICSNNEGTILKADERTLQSVWGKYLSTRYESLFGHPPITTEHYSQFIKEELSLCPLVVQHISEEIEHLGARFQLADYYRIQLLENLIVMSYRISQGCHHQKSSGYVFERVTELDTYYIAYDMASRIESAIGLTYKTEDRVFLNECLIANGIKNTDLTDFPEYYSDLVSEMIFKLSQIMNEDLTEDRKLRKGLLHHIVPMCFRLKNGIALQNPYIHEIKRQYSMMFHLTWYVAIDLENELGKRIPEDEIAFLMIHFQSALERKRDIKKILIISQTGLLTTDLLERRIKRYLPSVHIYEVITEDKIGQVDLEKVDLIISTVALKIKASPVLTLSSIPSDTELKDLVSQMNAAFSTPSHHMKRVDASSQEHPLIASISKHLTIDRIHVQSREEALTRLIDPLIKVKTVTAEYRSSVFEREEMSSTAFETGIAIPHGNPAYVKETHISLLINDRKISWGTEKVDVVVMISVARDDIQHIGLIIERLYDVMQSRADVERLFINQSDQSIYRFFAGYH
ncbi:MAG: transcription antiterminator [Alkalibacterium sp.]|nr:transcription antiterminator [Alkalibacterium sp.]